MGTNKTPVGFTHFLNSYFNLQKTTNFQCNFTWNYNNKRPLGYQFCKNTTNIKTRATKSLYPHKSENETCAVMLHTNLVDPQWILIDCQIELFNTIYCMKSKFISSESNFEKNQNAIDQDMACLPSFLRKVSICLLFVWKEKSASKQRNSNHHSEEFGLTPVSMVNLDFIQDIFDAVLASFPPILQNVAPQDKSNDLHLILGIFSPKLESQSQTQGLQILQKKTEKVIRGSHLFQCKSGSHIASLFICDGQNDCHKGGSDEINCTNQAKLNLVQNSGDSFVKSCNPLHYRSASGLCSKYTVRSINQKKPTHFTLCHDGEKIQTILADDLVADCGPNGEDEPVLTALITQQIEHDCKNKFQIACFPGHSKCFNVTDICVYKLDKFKHVCPCRNGGHMVSCANFECNHHYKCVLSYCIPWSYICDGKWDCPNGDEEKYTPICGTSDAHKCVLMYRCRRTNVLCLHPHSVCDGIPNCPLQDDEMFCALHNIICPNDCSCLLFAMSCSGINPALFVDTYPHIFLSIYQSSLPSKTQTFIAKFQFLIHMEIIKASLSQICEIAFAQSLQNLNVTWNEVRFISKNCFSSSTKIMQIDLSKNSVSSVQSHSFGHLSEIKYLDLSFNPLTHLVQQYSPPLTIWVLNLENISFSFTSKSVFDSSHVFHILATDYHICCMTQARTQCVSERPWYRSCSQMLPSKAVHWCVCVILFAVLSGNVFSIAAHLYRRTAMSKVFLSTVIAVHLNDLLMFVFLTNIWAFHLVFSQAFAVHEEVWRSSKFCFSAFCISLWVTIQSPCFCFVLSLFRLKVVLNPMKAKLLRTSHVINTNLCCVATLFGSSSAATLLMYFLVGPSPTNLCLPFVDPARSVMFIKGFIIFVTVLHFACSCCGVWMHQNLIKSATRTDLSVQKTRNKSLLHLVVHLCLLTATNFLCWFPADTIFIGLMILPQYPLTITAWTVTTVLPVNALVTPWIFVFGVIKKHT